jgi:hypothetical protein
MFGLLGRQLDRWDVVLILVGVAIAVGAVMAFDVPPSRALRLGTFFPLAAITLRHKLHLFRRMGGNGGAPRVEEPNRQGAILPPTADQSRGILPPP